LFGRCGLADLTRCLRSAGDTLAAERGVDLQHQPTLAAVGRVPVNHAQLRGTIERGNGSLDCLTDCFRGITIGSSVISYRDGLADESLGRRATWLVDRSPLLRLPDSLEGRWRSCAGPATR
jgi:hypothetical protein